MNDCYLNFLVSFRALFSLDVGANLVNSKQTIGIILPDLSLLGYAVPVESFGIGLFVILFAYLIIEYNVQLLSHEKFKIAMNMLHTAHTPLILLRNQLEELKTGNLPEILFSTFDFTFCRRSSGKIFQLRQNETGRYYSPCIL